MSFLDSIPFEEESVSAIMRRYPDQAKAMMALTELIMRSGECALTSGQRELIAAFASGSNNCAYCFGAHRSTAEAFGVDVDMLDALIENVDSAKVDASLKPVLNYVKKLTLTPSRMVQADVDEIFKAGWNENDFHYIVMITAFFNFFNRLMEGYGAKNTSEYQYTRGQQLAETGYALSKK